MKAGIFLTLAFLGLIAANAAACGPGYYCSGYATPYGYSYETHTPLDYYGYEAWDGYMNWEYYAPNGRYYSYYGPAYYGYHYYYPYNYTGPYYYNYYYPPAVYYHAPYQNYYDYSVYYYSPGFSVSARW